MDRAAITAVEEAFGELKKNDVINSYQRKDETGERKKLMDVVFTVRASMDFIRETKAANKRLIVAHEKPAKTR